MRRAVLAVAGLVVLLAVAAALSADFVMQTAFVRGRLAAAAERATGHRTNLADAAILSVSGVWTLRPTIEARAVAVFNPPGFSRPALATVSRLSARVALLPLLAGRVDVPSVLLDGADVLLERDAAGHGNWERPADPAAAPQAEPSTGGGRRPVRVGHVSVVNTVVAWKGGPVATVTSLDAEPSGGPVAGAFVLNGHPAVLDGRAGPDGFDVVLTGSGTRLALARQGGGPLTLHGETADLSSLAPLLGRPLPPLRSVVLDGQIAPGGAISLHGTAGSSDLGDGLVLQRLDVASPALDAPVRVRAEGLFRALPLAADIDLPPPAALRGGDRLAMRAVLSAAGGMATLSGSVADLAGGDPQGTLAVRVPDLAAAGQLAAVPLPGLHDLVLDARLAPAPGGGVAIRGLRATAREGDLGGDLVVRASPLPSLRGSLVSTRLDLDAAAPTAPANDPGSVPVPATTPAAPPAAPAAPPAAPSAAPTSVLDAPLPFARLRTADIDLRMSVAELTWHGVPFRAVLLRLLLADGQLRLDPAEAQTPGGAVQAQVTADATAVPPAASVALLAPGLDAGALAAALGRPTAASGAVDLDIGLHASGATLRAMLPTLDGHAGAALVNGGFDYALLAPLLGPALQAAGLPGDLSGQLAIRCLAVRAEAKGGRVELGTFTLDSSRARVSGEGTVNLIDGTMDLHLRPIVRLGGASVAVPVHLVGPFRAPKPSLERGAVSPGRVGLSILLGGGAAPDACPPALAAARANRPGPQPQ